MEIWPVIHTRDLRQVMHNASLAAIAGCNGVLLISMHGDDESLDVFAPYLKRLYPKLKVGVNYLRLSASDALGRSQRFGCDATWTDRQVFTNGEMSEEGLRVTRILAPPHKLFAAVAFKGQPIDRFPVYSAGIASQFGAIPTTSGVGTGIAPDIDKIRRIWTGLPPERNSLAVASGLTPDNIGAFKPYISHALVATGISNSFHSIDSKKLKLFVANAS